MRLRFPLALALTLLPAASGQTTVDSIQVRVADGRSGKAVKGMPVSVSVYPETKYRTPVDFTTDRRGAFTLLAQHTGELSVVVSGYPLCVYMGKADRKNVPVRFSVAQISSTGIVAPDTCGHRTDALQPGMLTLYVRPASWWHRLF